jgi:ribokinase
MKIGVLGSINIDIVYHVDKIPAQGETLFGQSYAVLPGGKGANQAVMMEALGADVRMMGAVGNDEFSHVARQALSDKGLSTDSIQTTQAGTGIAIIQLANNDNSIVVIPGANQQIKRTDVDVFFDQHPQLDGVVTQCETNIDVVEYFLQQAHRRSIRTVLNPAPAQPIPVSWMEFVDVIIPNEHEAQIIFGAQPLESLVAQYPNRMVITLGSQGAMYHDGQAIQYCPAVPITVVDTTGAGDSFVAGFSVKYFAHSTIADAVDYAMNIAATTCRYLGAQGAYTILKEKQQ